MLVAVDDEDDALLAVATPEANVPPGSPLGLVPAATASIFLLELILEDTCGAMVWMSIYERKR